MNMHTTTDYIALQVSRFAEPISVGVGVDESGEPVVTVDDGGCDLPVRRGEIVGVLGAQGTGKSALVRRTAEALLADEGRITLSGPGVLRDELAVKRLLNRVLADAQLFHRLTPLENLIYGARLYRLGEQDARRCAVELLNRFGLQDETISRPVGELDAQARRKAAAACALLTPPAFLLLDEPTRGVSETVRQERHTLLEELRDVYRAAVLFTTGDPGEAESLCDRVALLRAGQIVALEEIPARV